MYIPSFLFSFNEGLVPAAFIMFYSSFNCIKTRKIRDLYYIVSLYIFLIIFLSESIIFRLRLILNLNSNSFVLDFRKEKKREKKLSILYR